MIITSLKMEEVKDEGYSQQLFIGEGSSASRKSVSTDEEVFQRRILDLISGLFPSFDSLVSQKPQKDGGRSEVKRFANACTRLIKAEKAFLEEIYPGEDKKILRDKLCDFLGSFTFSLRVQLMSLYL